MSRNNEPQAVRDGTIAGELVYLRGVMNWASKWQNEDGTYMLREDPTRGYPIPREKNPRRPVADEERFQRVLAAAPEVQMAVGRGGARRWVRSYLAEILIIVNGTGRRINSILHLRYVNLRLDQKPFGAIHWSADFDKTGKEWLVPISKDVRVAIDNILQERPGIGAAFIFPSVNDASKPLAGDVASSWLMAAERLAKLPKLDGSLWHAYRRKWATERKHLPDVDVAAAGGWTALASLQGCYQHADSRTMFEVVSSPTRLGETLER